LKKNPEKPRDFEKPMKTQGIHEKPMSQGRIKNPRFWEKTRGVATLLTGASPKFG